MMRLILWIALLLEVTFSLSSHVHAEAIRTVALSGQHAPGTVGNVRFGGFSAPQLNSDGQVAFQANLVGEGICCGIFGGVYNNSGIWTGDAVSLALAVRDGDQASGLPAGVRYSSGYRFNNFTDFEFSSNGNLAFSSNLQGPDVDGLNCCGLWTVSNQSTNLVFRTGDHAPGAPANVTFGGEGALKINSAGQLTLDWEVLKDGGANNARMNAIWSGSAGALNLIATEGEHAPGMPADVSFFYFNSPGNSAAHVAFHAKLSGGAFDLTNSAAVWSNRSGSLAMVARVDGQAPGMPNGVVFAWFDEEVLLNANDNIAFVAGLKGPGVSDSSAAIWSDVGGSLTPVVQTGQLAPGTPSGIIFDGFVYTVMNNTGKIAFSGYLSGSGVNDANNRGIWSNGAGPLRLLAREGDAVPGMNGKVWGEGDVILNDAGQGAFHAFLTDPGNLYDTSMYSLWAEDKAGNLHLIVRKGGQIEVSPGDFRTVRSFEDWMDTNGDGSAAGFNEKGQYAFYASFTDGSSGIFVSDVATIPEPGCLTLLALGMFALPCRRRRS